MSKRKSRGQQLAEAVEAMQFCESCQRYLVHDRFMCPLFPQCVPRAPVRKWSECVCLIHTCYAASKLDDKSKAKMYEDF